MRWKLAKKLMSRKTVRLESHKYIKRFQAKRYAKLRNIPFWEVENHCWKIWFAYVNYFKWGNDNIIPLSKRDIISEGFDEQSEILSEMLEELVKTNIGMK